MFVVADIKCKTLRVGAVVDQIAWVSVSVHKVLGTHSRGYGTESDDSRWERIRDRKLKLFSGDAKRLAGKTVGKGVSGSKGAAFKAKG